MNPSSPMLLPILTLIAWSTFIWCWMYATRIPAIVKFKMKLDANAPRGEQMNTLPPSVRWKADNYNNLMEHPTLFYALALVLVVSGHDQGLNLILAWSYVVLRVIHSLVQALFNNIRIRFSVFFLSGLVFFALLINASTKLF